MKTLIIFDLDGTLAHTAPDLLSTLNRVITPLGLIPMDLSYIGQIIGQGAKAMIGRAFEINGTPLSEELHERLLGEFLADYSENLANDTMLYDGVLRAIEDLGKLGCSFAVCTNKKHSMAVPLLEKLKVSSLFLSVTGGDSFAFRKPDARHLEKTAELAGFALQDCIMIGDSEADIGAAINAKIPSIAVSFGYSDKPVETLGATAVIDHYKQLVETVTAIKQSSSA